MKQFKGRAASQESKGRWLYRAHCRDVLIYEWCGYCDTNTKAAADKERFKHSACASRTAPSIRFSNAARKMSDSLFEYHKNLFGGFIYMLCSHYALDFVMFYPAFF
jgi:hypothetical protein